MAITAYDALAETDDLLRSPVNAARLLTAAEQVRQGRSLITKSRPATTVATSGYRS
jgi:PHD/YefM family antitoxin component YafN of YafNO toxin-antitoxin module